MTVLHQPRAVVTERRPTTRHHATSIDMTRVNADGTIVDLAAVERALNGLPVTLTDAEMYEAGRQLDARGYQPREIAARTGMNLRRVARWKAAGWPEQRPNPRRGLRRDTNDRKEK